MEKIMKNMRDLAKEALSNNEIDKILGWQKGDLWSDSYPAFIDNIEDADTLVWDKFCVNNLSKFLIKELKEVKKVGIFLKGCDSKAFNQLLKDNRVDREKVKIFGVPCDGMIDPEKIKKATSNKRIVEINYHQDKVEIKTRKEELSLDANDLKYEKCKVCLSPNPVIYDELLGEEVVSKVDSTERFKGVEEVENMSPDEKYEFWSKEFEKCLRCNACRDICPACNCVKCTFGNTENKETGTTKNQSEDTFFHLVRAYHVAGRCVDCGECARVCPEGIPLDKLNRKIIKDINENYGEFDAGQDSTTSAPLVTFELEDTDTFSHRGGKR